MAAEQRDRRQRGSTLIEVMVAVFVLSVGLLGLMALQIKAQEAEVDAYQRSQAVIILEDMANRLYANRENPGCYLTGEFAKLPGQWEEDETGYLNCSDASDRDLAAWNRTLRGAAEVLGGGEETRLVGAMIGAVGCIELLDAGSTLMSVSVAWQGLSDRAVPADPCGQGLINPDTRRRVASILVRLDDWK